MVPLSLENPYIGVSQRCFPRFCDTGFRVLRMQLSSSAGVATDTRRAPKMPIGIKE